MSTGRPASLEEAHGAIAEAVSALVSGEDWRAFLAVAARLHAYSASNLAWLMAQGAARGWEPSAMGPLGGYRTLQSLGLQVRRGEKSLLVLAPLVRRRRVLQEDGTERLAGTVVGFRLAHVFDGAHQADGSLPEAPRPQLLKGEGPAGLLEALSVQIEEAGYCISYEPLHPANGRTDFGVRTVVIADRLSPAHRARTAAHELAHLRLHAPGMRAEGESLSRGRAEVEAESVAFLVCSRMGLDCGSSVTFPYIAHWSGGEIALVQETAAGAISAAREILNAIEAKTEPAGAVPGRSLSAKAAGRASWWEAEEAAHTRRSHLAAEHSVARRAQASWGLDQ